MSRNADEILNELLVLRAQRGDAPALQLLVRRWHPKLIRHARKLTEREDAAADVVQEAWVAVFRGLHRLQDPATFRGWIYRIVHHKSVDWIRSQTRERKLRQDIGRQITAAPGNPSEQSTDVERLRNAIVRLTAEQQLLLRMFYDDRMPLKEIAAVLDTPVGTLKFQLFSLRQKLKKMIEGDTL
ncbi:MAG: RNA polymerase sigma factor [Pirellulaceae bacterium]|jgi:RNA polymerase sigma-70 factor (ECF subfamily)|nr:RNA polymerase sigma factor [Pirellulaceae bacterium]